MKLALIGYLAWLLFLVLGAIGWVMNIVNIINQFNFDELTGMMVAQIIGVFIVPLGMVLGWIT